MKKIVLIILFSLPFVSFSQKTQDEKRISVINYLESKLNKHVTFVLFQEVNDTIKILQFSVYDTKNKKYINYYKKDVEKLFPKLFFGYTIDTRSPSSSSDRSDVDVFY